MNTKYQSIYLLQEREFVNLNENVYKIGKTTQEGLRRLANYPKGSRLILHIHCNDCTKCELEIIDLFKKNFISRDESKEHFQGSIELMITLIVDITKNDRNYSYTNSKEISKDSPIPTIQNQEKPKIKNKEEVLPIISLKRDESINESEPVPEKKEKKTIFPLQCPYCPLILKDKNMKSIHLNQKSGLCRDQHKRSKETK